MTSIQPNKLTPCLWFDGAGEDAARFYTGIFEDSRITSTSYYGEGGPMPAGTALTVSFELAGHPFVALNGGPDHPFTEAISFQVACADQAEVDRYWDALTEGGEEGPCGWLTDRFGLSWQVVPTRLTELLTDPDPAVAGHAAQALFGMKKIVIADLEPSPASARS